MTMTQQESVFLIFSFLKKDARRSLAVYASASTDISPVHKYVVVDLCESGCMQRWILCSGGSPKNVDISRFFRTKILTESGF